jgi:hypothetical protein
MGDVSQRVQVQAGLCCAPFGADHSTGKGFHCTVVRTDRRCGGVSVLVREGLPSLLLPHLPLSVPAIETCAVSVPVGDYPRKLSFGIWNVRNAWKTINGLYPKQVKLFR